jgi:hypothetical protein
MAMICILCRLSKSRLELLESDPSLLEDVVEERRNMKIPGLLDLGKTWDALDILLSDRGKDALLGDAVVARSGKKMKGAAGFRSARVLDPKRVAEVAAALGKLEPETVKKRYPKLHGREVHGSFGQETATPDDAKYLREKVAQIQEKEISALGDALKQIVTLYGEAAENEASMLSVIV